MAVHLSNHYRTLELEITASEEDVKKAYKRLALKYHPDKNVNDSTAEEKFKNISEAYRIINQASSQCSNPMLQQSSQINAQNLFGQFFGNNINSMNFRQTQTRSFVQTQTRSFVIPQPKSTAQTPISTNASYTSSSVQIVNGKIIETIVERKNGATRKRTVVREAS